MDKARSFYLRIFEGSNPFARTSLGDVMIGIYCITNLINKKVYIGQSVNIEQRWKAHRITANNSNSPAYDKSLYRAFRKYGLNNFNFKILETCSIEELNEKERYWISQYCSNIPEHGYNLTAGGQSGKPAKLNETQVEEIRELLTNTSLTELEIAKQYNISQRMVNGINLGQYWVHESLTYPLRKVLTSTTCIDCGKSISNVAQRCVQCAHKLLHKTIHPSREELKNKIRKSSFVSIGKEYNVSDNAVRKWCTSYNLPTSKRIIKKYSDEQWEKI